MKFANPVFLFFIFLAFRLPAQTTDKLVKEIAANNRVESKHVGYGGIASRQYARYQQLSQKASTAELEKLCSHSNPAVRVYAAYALTERKSGEYGKVFLAFLSDTALAETQSGCIVWRLNPAAMLFGHFNELLSEKNTEATVLKNIRTADSILLHTDFKKPELQNNKSADFALTLSDPSHLRNEMLKRYQPVAGDEVRLHELYREGNTLALPALARFRQDADTSLILHAQYMRHKAIREFPHPVFFRSLRKDADEAVFKSSFDFSDYAEAIAIYNNASSDSLIEKIHGELVMKAYRDSVVSDLYFSNNNNSGLEKSAMEKLLSLHIIMLRNYRDAFAPLMLEAWKTHGIQSLEGWGKILASNPKELAESSLGYLEDDHRLRFVSFNYHADDDSMQRKIISLIRKNHPEKLAPYAAKNIPKKTFEDLDVVLGIAAETRDSTCAEAILQTMKVNSKTYDLFALSKTILSYSDTSYHRRAQEIMKKNRGWGWNNEWYESFTKLYRGHNVPLD